MGWERRSEPRPIRRPAGALPPLVPAGRARAHSAPRRDGAGDRDGEGRAVGPLRLTQARRRARLHILHRHAQPEGSRARPQPARRARLLLGRDREAGTAPRPRPAGIGRRGRRLLANPPAREPARRDRVTSERAAREPRRAARALATAPPPVPRQGHRATVGLGRLPRRPARDRVLDAAPASPAPARAFRAERPRMATPPPPAMKVSLFYLPSVGSRAEIEQGRAGLRTDLYQRMLAELAEQARL